MIDTHLIVHFWHLTRGSGSLLELNWWYSSGWWGEWWRGARHATRHCLVPWFQNQFFSLFQWAPKSQLHHGRVVVTLTLGLLAVGRGWRVGQVVSVLLVKALLAAAVAATDAVDGQSSSDIAQSDLDDGSKCKEPHPEGNGQAVLDECGHHHEQKATGSTCNQGRSISYHNLTVVIKLFFVALVPCCFSSKWQSGQQTDLFFFGWQLACVCTRSAMQDFSVQEADKSKLWRGAGFLRPGAGLKTDTGLPANIFTSSRGLLDREWKSKVKMVTNDKPVIENVETGLSFKYLQTLQYLVFIIPWTCDRSRVCQAHTESTLSLLLAASKLWLWTFWAWIFQLDWLGERPKNNKSLRRLSFRLSKLEFGTKMLPKPVLPRRFWHFQEGTGQSTMTKFRVRRSRDQCRDEKSWFICKQIDSILGSPHVYCQV